MSDRTSDAISHTCINTVNIMAPAESCKACAEEFARDPVAFAKLRSPSLFYGCVNCGKSIASTGLCEACGVADATGYYRGVERAAEIVDAVGFSSPRDLAEKIRRELGAGGSHRRERATIGVEDHEAECLSSARSFCAGVVGGPDVPGTIRRLAKLLADYYRAGWEDALLAKKEGP